MLMLWVVIGLLRVKTFALQRFGSDDSRQTNPGVHILVRFVLVGLPVYVNAWSLTFVILLANETSKSPVVDRIGDISRIVPKLPLMNVCVIVCSLVEGVEVCCQY